ncbi:MAG: hypothetical protein FJW34_17310 [Acidobacteria bacterium]|nr:hypothetical protein [Acidobacteriota bacterium]
MRKFNYLLGAAVLAAGFTVATSVSYAKPEYTKTEKAKCVVCHTKGKELNKVGECWKESKNLKECEEKEKK